LVEMQAAITLQLLHQGVLELQPLSAHQAQEVRVLQAVQIQELQDLQACHTQLPVHHLPMAAVVAAAAGLQIAMVARVAPGAAAPAELQVHEAEKTELQTPAVVVAVDHLQDLPAGMAVQESLWCVGLRPTRPPTPSQLMPTLMLV
jgi:hypothetical protein